MALRRFAPLGVLYFGIDVHYVRNVVSGLQDGLCNILEG